jgi:hypothetical protein
MSGEHEKSLQTITSSARELIARVCGEEAPPRELLTELYDRVCEVKASLPEGEEGLREALEAVQEKLRLATKGEGLGEEEEADLHASCNELRLRMLSVGRLFFRTGQGESSLLEVLNDPSGHIGEIVHEDSGVSYAKVMDGIVIVLPHATEQRAVEAVERSLLRIFDLTPPGTSWVMDLSAVRELPFSLYGSLLAYAWDLDIRGGTLHLSWVNDELKDNSPLGRRWGLFRLVKSGAFWFSNSAYGVI